MLVGPVTRMDPYDQTKSNYTVVRFEELLVGIAAVDRARWEAALHGAPETRYGRPYGMCARARGKGAGCSASSKSF